MAISINNSKIFILKPNHSTRLCSQTVVIIYDGLNRDIVTEDCRGFDMKVATEAVNLTAIQGEISCYPCTRGSRAYHWEVQKINTFTQPYYEYVSINIY